MTNLTILETSPYNKEITTSPTSLYFFHGFHNKPVRISLVPPKFESNLALIMVTKAIPEMKQQIGRRDN